MTLTKQAQFILDEIARRYDQGYASRIRSMTEFKLSVAYPEEGLLQLVALYQVMDEEGFSQSERASCCPSTRTTSVLTLLALVLLITKKRTDSLEID